MSTATDSVTRELATGLALVTPETAIETPDARPARPLSELPLHTDARVVALLPPDEPHDPEILARLGELGFLPGEPVRILARGLFGDPLAVRVGTGTFALRRGEARCVQVRPEGATR
ncbi:MAG: FeoA family protein [Steroidobacteraceae bacterium]|nr:FeoA family protein [Steroidobacteraceae bacterium]